MIQHRRAAVLALGLLAAAALAALVGPAARAHPFSSDLTGHRVAVFVGQDALHVDYLAELPTRVLLGELREHLAAQGLLTDADGRRIQPEKAALEAAEAAFSDAMHQELADSFRLEVDGASVPLHRAEIEVPTGVGDARFVIYRVALTAALPAGFRTVHLVNGALPDRPSLFHMDLRLAPSLVVDDASVFELSGREVRRSQLLTWRADEALRELRLSLRHRGATVTAVDTALGQLSDAPLLGPRPVSPVGSTDPIMVPDVPPGLWRPAREAVWGAQPSAAEALGTGFPSTPLAIWVLALAAVLGGVGGLGGRHGLRRLGLATGAAWAGGAVLVGLLGPAFSSGAATVAAVGALLACGMAGWRGRPGPAVAGAVLLLAVSGRPALTAAAVLVLACGAAGVTVIRRRLGPADAPVRHVGRLVALGVAGLAGAVLVGVLY